MLLSNNSKVPVSFESTELIRELERDIKEFGEHETFLVWVRKYPQYDNAEVLVNYDFINDENPITDDELGPNERFVKMRADILLDILKKQNELIETYKVEL